jgi:RNA polymerase-binding protein DksA
MDPQKARTLLVAERERLTETLEELESSTDAQKESLQELSVYDQHQGDIGTETFEMEKDLSIIESVQAGLRDVDEALQRVEEGTFGRCQRCGAPIADERLEAMPAARLCLEHQAEAEGAHAG